ncbi:MAG: hypothetical protein KAI81_04350 [Candidatus Marinimicrobia bacterium]|nr:hypothetical protein [Candidatus Neomarinimicrobiota bacterium]
MIEKIEKGDLLINLLTEMNKSLKKITQKISEHTNTHETFSFSTAGSTSFHKDVHELLSLPRGYYANSMTIFDIGGGFTFKINGENEAITAIKNMSITNEEIYKIELIPASVAGTAKVRFGAYIERN